LKERDYVMVSELTRLRCAVSVLRDVCAENAAGPMKVPATQAVEEYREIMSRLDCWVARLEWAVSPDDRDREPWRREWPCKEGAKR
jgi:hypothetical protein